MLNLGLFTYLLFLITPIVSAQFYSGAGNFFQRGVEEVFDGIRGFAAPFFSYILNTDSYDQYFFSKVLVLVLLFVVIFSITKHLKFIEEDQRGVRFVIAAAMSIISMRYISEMDFIQGILLPYGVLAVAITLGLTLLIFGTFIHDLGSPGARRIGWAIYLALFLGIWIDRSSELSRGANITYSIVLLFIVILFVFDKNINNYFGTMRIHEAYRNRIKLKMADIEAKLNTLYAISHPSSNVQDTIKMLEKEHKRLAKKL